MSGEPIARPWRYEGCFGCGRENAHGLRLDFVRDGDSVVAAFVPRPEHGGYGRIVHGGITAALVDETLGWTIFGLLGRFGMTTEMRVSYVAPLLAGARVELRGRLERADEREAVVRVEVRDATGRVAAEGTGTLRFITPRAVARLGGFDFGEGPGAGA